MTAPRTATITAVILAAAVAATTAYAAPHPSISKLHASLKSLASSGGHIVVSAHVKHAQHCTLSALPHLAKLPHTVACSKKSVAFHVTIPADATAAVRAYVLKLKATSANGAASAHLTVKVAASSAAIQKQAEETKAREEREAKEKQTREREEKERKEKTEKEEQETHEREEREHKEKEEQEERERSPAVQVAVGEAEACAVLMDGKIYCWGEDEYGQIGNGAKEELALKPTEVKGIEDATQISIGQHDVCALVSTGHVECWGENARGQVGNEKDEESAVETPVEVNHLEHAVEIKVGWTFACARIEGGTVKCWGQNNFGNVGNGKTANAVLVPEEANVTGVAKISTYFKHTCALLTTGTLKCWGYDFFDELGNNEEKKEAVSTPEAAFYPKGVSDVSVGHYDTCAIEGGAVSCWGNKYHGQLGNGETSNENKVQYEPVSTGISEGEEVALSYENACVRLKNGHVECWGTNGRGAIGNGTDVPGEIVDSPLEVSKLTEATQIALGGETACALVKGGQVYCWGNDSRGQVGNESSSFLTGVDEPSEVKNLP